MPTPTAEEFWSLLVTSGLVDAGAAAALRREHEADPTRCGGGTAKGIAAWLETRGVLTGWQAKRLGIGNLGPFFLGDYRLLERHDREGDALSFTARHEPSGRIVSVVMLNAKRCRKLDVWTEIVQRTTAASQATDPMLSRTWSLEQHESSRLIVCEHVEGMSLAAEVDRHGPLPAVQAGVLVAQIARAVAELHALGSVHGNLSLEVLLRESPPGGVPRTGRVRLLQFPQAGDPHRLPLRPWNDDAELAALGRSAAFVAPELMLPGSVSDPRTDVYSLGGILSALVSGAWPCWEGDAARTLKRAAFGAGPAALGPPAVAPEIATLIGYLMARDPAERYQTAAEAADAIAACLGLATGGGAGGVARPSASQPGVPAATASPRPVDADEIPDFLGAGAGGAASAPPLSPARLATGPGAAGPGPQGGTAALIRRRRTQLRLFGGGITLAILGGTAALVISKLDWRPKQVPATVAVGPREKPAPAPAQEPVGWGPLGQDPPGEKPASPSQQPAVSAEQPDGEAPAAAAASRQIVVDDPALPWASPTEGQRPRLAYLAPGSQLVLLARPAALLGDEEGRRFVESLGPQAAAGLAALAKFCGCDPAEIEAVQAGWQAGGIDQVLGAYAVRLVDGRELPADEAARRQAWGATTAVQVEGETIHQGDPFSFWVPSTEHNRVLVVAPEAAAAGIAGLPGAADARETLMSQIVRQAVASRGAAADALLAELPLELEQLAGMLDESRHLTLFGSPHYLLTQGRVVLAGPLAKLAEPLESLFGESLQAAAVSAHFSEHCYLELDALATRDVPPKELATELAVRVDGLPDAVEQYCAALNPAPYGRVLVMRLPQMLRFLTANMRRGAEGKGVVLNAYLPLQAGHNIALATELALAQAPGATVAVAGPAAPAAGGDPAAPAGALGKLEQKITLVFARDTLEKSIQMIADEIGTPMDISGPDLQLEGITKNQSFGLESRDKPAREVLVEILAKANPDGKLVYIVRQEDGVETILVTTRAAVEKRGDKLPPGLEPPAEEKKRKS
jgi:serine/threonine-protein kinase